MIEKVLHPKNLTRALQRVISNKGAAGIDNMTVKDLKAFADENRTAIASSILNRTYIPKPVKGRVER
ncbi:hypothetical protein RCC89_03490 [Cytophagaceae bacterium ABcell3]|nr:hypothetical protein RCC89_03490 [Cytophagaceae bacterium ABcell3]